VWDEADYGDPPSGGYWETETGHHAMLNLGHDGNWDLSVLHPGDPSGSIAHVNLGPDEDGLHERVSHAFRDREFTGHLGDQYNRARLNGNATGYDFASERVKPSRDPSTDVYLDRSR
jgi:hypothetical protein